MHILEKVRIRRDRVLLRLSQVKFKDFWYQRTISRVLAKTPADKARFGIKRTVRLIGNFPGLWQRTIEQTPGGSCRWGHTLFVAQGPADHYVILNAPPAGLQWPAGVPRKEHVWGLHMEPEEYVLRLGYSQPGRIKLASRFYTSSEALLATGGVYRPSPPYVHFHVGKSWDYLQAVRAPSKTITLGIITSELRDLAGHQARLRFLDALDASGIDYALWGRGEGLRKYRNYRGFAMSKWDVHAPCRYSLVIENSVSPLYWSEKVADALLAYSLPLYHGSEQLSQFLPKDCFIPINIFEPDCINRIRTVLEADPYNERMAAIEQARGIILNKENLYAFLDRELDTAGVDASASGK
ncbi:MAG: hypothetical protein JWQ90_2942 [Hydrocarboniphaga sp.]|uniref:glycosyltransferase family 10 domain-containing protein n=1 Tax=Hydrocarboniphaga sp. TaxID=2033016 RepID=UPI00262653E7|nr:glycosyltransferase family 10 [Hydrocarboniphaga sp.]MDB5970492.1 hypothetical protein [Hydrocarboniphaga sp.]